MGGLGGGGGKYGLEDSISNIDPGLFFPGNQLIFSFFDILVLLLNHSNNITRNYDAFLGCSETSISAIVKHMCNILELLELPGLFICLGGTEKIAGLWFATEDQ